MMLNRYLAFFFAAAFVFFLTAFLAFSCAAGASGTTGASDAAGASGAAGAAGTSVASGAGATGSSAFLSLHAETNPNEAITAEMTTRRIDKIIKPSKL
jgi:hypothetical protein